MIDEFENGEIIFDKAKYRTKFDVSLLNFIKNDNFYNYF